MQIADAPTAEAPRSADSNELSQSELAYRGLRRLVREGHYSPGEMLSEGGVAELLGVGRTPIREAVSRLAHEGLLTRMPKRGVVVASLSVDDVRELYDLHAALEALCVRTAFERDDSGLGVRLAAILDEAAGRVDAGISWREYRVEDLRFHQAIWDAGHNRRAAELLEASNDAAILDPWFHQISDVDGQQQRSLAEHRRIVDALVADDLVAAEEAVWEHHRSYQRQLARRLFGAELGMSR